MSHRCRCCGWSGATYHGLRTHQGIKGCTPKGLSIPMSDQYRWASPPSKLREQTWQVNAFSPTPSWEKNTTQDTSIQTCHCGWTKVTTWHGLRTHQGMMGCTPKEQKTPRNKPNPVFGSPAQSSKAWRMEARQDLQRDFENLASGHMTTSPRVGTAPVGGQASTATPVKREQSTFGVLPDNCHPNPLGPLQTTMNMNMLEGFSLLGLQVQNVAWEHPAASQETTKRATENATHEQIDLDKIKTKLRRSVQVIGKKSCEIRASGERCKDQLKREKQEIYTVFARVRAVVDLAEMKALQPLEERTKSLEREMEHEVGELQKEIRQLEDTISELDAFAELPTQQSLPRLDDVKDCTQVALNTSISFGTMKAITSSMMEQIELELERLSSIEMKRIPIFAVDVQLDQKTANPRLVLSDDGKEVRDGGNSQSPSNGPDEFDCHCSVLALNKLVSGKYYWEVEVGNKTGWDLGITRGNANRKGQLQFKPLNGYWAIVHFVGKQFVAMSDPPTQLFPKEKLKKVGVFVDYEEGLVSFYDAEARAHIYSFIKCCFTGDLYPYFSPHLRNGTANSSPLVISHVKC